MFQRIKSRVFSGDDKANDRAPVVIIKRIEVIAQLKLYIETVSKAPGWKGRLDLSVSAVRNIMFSPSAAIKTDIMHVDAGADTKEATFVPLTDPRVIKLTGSEIVELKDEIKNANVAVLNLEGHDIDSFGAEQLVVVINNCPYLNKIIVACNPLGQQGNLVLTRAQLERSRKGHLAIEGQTGFNIDVKEPCIRLAAVMELMTWPYVIDDSSYLNVARCDQLFGNASSVDVVTKFMTKNRLHAIDLANTRLLDRLKQQTARKLANALGQQPLESLSLSGNDLFGSNAEKGIGFLNLVFSAIDSSLDELDLSNTQLQNSGAMWELRMVFASAKLGITSLNLSGNNLAGCMPHVMEMLASTPHLTELQVNNCNLGPEDIKIFAVGLKTNSTLRRLAMEGNPIGSAGIQALADALSTNPRLEELYVRDIGDSDQNIAKIINALDQREEMKVENARRKLKTLAISNNSFGSTAATNLAALISKPSCQLREVAIDIPVCNRAIPRMSLSAECIELGTAIRQSRTIIDCRARWLLANADIEALNSRKQKFEQDKIYKLFCWMSVATIIASANTTHPHANSVLELIPNIIALIIDPLNIPLIPAVNKSVNGGGGGDGDINMADEKSSATAANSASASASANNKENTPAAILEHFQKYAKRFTHSLFFASVVNTPKFSPAAAAAAAPVSNDADISMAVASRKRKMLTG